MEVLGVDNLCSSGPLHVVSFSLADIAYGKISDRLLGLDSNLVMLVSEKESPKSPSLAGQSVSTV